MTTAKVLLASLALPASVIGGRSSMPIIACLAIRDGRATGTNLEQTISAPVDTDIACCVDSARLAKTLSALPSDAEVTLAMEKDGRLLVKSGRSRVRLPTLSLDDFPVTQWVEPETVIEKPAELAAAIDSVQHAMAVKDIRYYLFGIATQGGHVIATDGHRAAIHACAALPDDIIIPAGAVPLIRAALDEETVRYAVDERELRVQANGYRITTRLVEGKFPDLARVTPKEVAHPWRCNREELLAAAKLVDRTSDARGLAFSELTVADGALTLRCRAPDGQTSESAAGCEHSGPGTIGLNARYLVQALEALDGETAEIHATDAQSAILILGANPAQRFVVMPARV